MEGAPSVGSSIPPVRRRWLQREAPFAAGQEPSAFLKTSFVVKSLLFVMCGCRSQLCRGWRLGGEQGGC